jgi:hypothetical protein
MGLLEFEDDVDGRDEVPVDGIGMFGGEGFVHHIEESD